MVVVDPGSPYEAEQRRLAEELERRGLSVEAIWLTHRHADHCGGAEALRRAEGVGGDLDVVALLALPGVSRLVEREFGAEDLDAFVDLAQDHVAGQHRADTRLVPDRLVGHLRVAGTQDLVARHIDVDQRNIRQLSFNFFDCAVPVIGFTDEFNISLVV